jgi:hypothetical protein
MARKRLIKGANATRVEARISRVPADLAGEGASIFAALRAAEDVPTPSAAPEVAASKGRASATKSKGKSSKGTTEAPKAAEAPAGRPKRARLRSSDFNAAELEAILRCCVEYRNRLPTYLLSAKGEVEVLDSIIEKCGRASSG